MTWVALGVACWLVGPAAWALLAYLGRSRLHCFAPGPGYGSVCMRPERHRGKHRFVPTDEVIVRALHR